MPDLRRQLRDLTPEGIFEKLGDLVVHQGPPRAEMIAPFSFRRGDEDALQEAARTIADFMGLNDYVFSVSVEDLPSGIAGGTSPQSADDHVIPIVIDPSVAFFNDAVLGVLTHEIAHQYLHVHGISYGSGPDFTLDNEILTDVSCTYLGLGKLVLRGCVCEHRVSEIMTHVEYVRVYRSQVGYLEPQQPALVYLRVLAMLDRPLEEGLVGLNISARKLIEAAMLRFRAYLQPLS